MSASNNPITGALYLFKGFGMITKPGLRRYVALPLLINITVFLGLGFLVFGWLDVLTEEFIATLPTWLQWLDWISEILIFLTLSLVSFFTFTLIANLISSPFNGPLSEAVERELTGIVKNDDGAWHDSITELPQVFADEGNKLFYSISRSLPFLLLFLIPVVNVIASAAWLIFGTWLMALQYMDYPLGNHKIRFKQQREVAARHRMLMMGFGGVVLAGSMIPIVNLFIIPAAVAGATALYVNELRDSTHG
jgi:CysZ protein